MAAEYNPENPMQDVNGAMLLRFHKWTCAAIGVLGLGLAQNALAQSSGTEALEESMDEVVVSATRVRNIGIVGDQTAPKSRISLAGDYLDSQVPGNTLFQGLNQLPGVNFANNDPYGSSGGNLRLRSFDGSRVSVTFDGVPLNDSGNYALFTNQMLDPELVDRVDVNLGTTDVDSPTASATGGTIAFRTRRPADEMGFSGTLSAGRFDYRRSFLRVDTGEFGPWGTKAFIAGSYTNYEKFKGPGELQKKQFNSVIRQDFENENFISLAFHFNRNRNAFYRNGSALNFEQYGFDFDNLATCTRDAPTFGVADNDNATAPMGTPTPIPPAPQFADDPQYPTSCSNFYGVRLNPSDTGNIRMQSLWHLGDKLILTFDPSWQYTLANGGGSTTIGESTTATTLDRRVLGARTDITAFDLNGDGDTLDTIRFYSPNTTNTKRWGATTSLIWDVSENHRMRVAYTWDRARHRQTGMWGPLDSAGHPENVFAGRQGERVLAADGEIIRGRDRFSIAELKQIALEYRGQFWDDKFTTTIGLRRPEFKRELNQYCYTPNGGNGGPGTIGASGGTYCTARAPFATLPNGNVTFLPAPMGGSAVEFIAPYHEEVEFDDILPNIGLSFNPWDRHQFYLSYAQGLSAPRTDNLYSVRRLTDGSVGRPTPETETTKAYDLGWRLNGSNTLASVAIWKVDYSDRIVTSFDPDLGISADRNVGDVEVEGVDMQIGQRLGSVVQLSASASYTKSEVLADLLNAQITHPVTGLPDRLFIPLKGKELVETPEWTFALRSDFQITEDFHVGLQGKWVDDRFSTDLNDEVSPGYTVVDLDMDYRLKIPGLESASIQVNVSNLLDKEYFGTISSGIGRGNNGLAGSPVLCYRESDDVVQNCSGQNGLLGFFSVGAPRTVLATFKFEF
jgi:iron complex outermembrane receptor protein